MKSCIDMTRPVLRTCVGCRIVREQGGLVRISADPEGGVIVNRGQAPAAPGRGAYLCPSLACFAQAWHRKAFLRALRCELPGLDQAKVRERFEAELRRRGVIARGAHQVSSGEAGGVKP